MRAEDGESDKVQMEKKDAVALGETRLVVDGFGGVLFRFFSSLRDGSRRD